MLYLLIQTTQQQFRFHLHLGIYHFPGTSRISPEFHGSKSFLGPPKINNDVNFTRYKFPVRHFSIILFGSLMQAVDETEIKEENIQAGTVCTSMSLKEFNPIN